MQRIVITTETRDESRTRKSLSDGPVTITEQEKKQTFEYDNIRDLTSLVSTLLNPEPEIADICQIHFGHVGHLGPGISGLIEGAPPLLALPAPPRV